MLVLDSWAFVPEKENLCALNSNFKKNLFKIFASLASWYIGFHVDQQMFFNSVDFCFNCRWVFISLWEGGGGGGGAGVQNTCAAYGEKN